MIPRSNSFVLDTFKQAAVRELIPSSGADTQHKAFLDHTFWMIGQNALPAADPIHSFSVHDHALLKAPRSVK